MEYAFVTYKGPRQKECGPAGDGWFGLRRGRKMERAWDTQISNPNQILQIGKMIPDKHSISNNPFFLFISKWMHCVDSATHMRKEQ